MIWNEKLAGKISNRRVKERVLKELKKKGRLAPVAGSEDYWNRLVESRSVVDDQMHRPHIGINAGVGSPEGSFNPGGQYSLEFGLQPYIPFGLAVEAGYSYFTDDAANLSRTSLLLRGSYHLGGDIPVIKYSYLGLGVGTAWEDSTVDEGLAAIVVPQLGFDFPLERLFSAPVSLGINASYTISSRSTPDVFTTSGAIKYWY